ERSDPVPRGDDQIVGTTLEVQVTVVLDDPIAGVPGTVIGRRPAAEMPDEEGRVGSRIGEYQLSVDDLQLDARKRAPHRSRANRFAHRIAGELSGLGLTVAIPDLDPKHLLERPDHLRVEGLSRRDKSPQRGTRAQR